MRPTSADTQPVTHIAVAMVSAPASVSDSVERGWGVRLRVCVLLRAPFLHTQKQVYAALRRYDQQPDSSLSPVTITSAATGARAQQNTPKHFSRDSPAPCI